MDGRRKKRVAPAPLGASVSHIREILGFPDAEDTLVEMRIELAEALREFRRKSGLSQADLAKALGETQSRVAKLENADGQANLELLVRALVAAGGTVKLRVA
ncbi:MAG: hypothetical protein RL385_1954 [Pseudomonadota bacterium]